MDAKYQKNVNLMVIGDTDLNTHFVLNLRAQMQYRYSEHYKIIQCLKSDGIVTDY